MLVQAILAAFFVGGLLAAFVFKEELLASGPISRLHERFAGPKEVEVSAPFGLVHRVHVDRDFTWKGEDPTHSLIIEERLGSGSFGSVYKARHKEVNFVIALKEVEMEGSEAERESLKAEIDILRQCRNANIVNYYGSYLREHELLIMMDYCSVGSVRDGMLLLGRTLTEPEIAHICFQSLKGLAYLHTRKPTIVHRDVKAANILINEHGEIKIADFGVSDRIQNTMAPGGHVGTLFWMAPEMLKKTPFNHTADIWSLAITAIEMAEGHPPRNEYSLYQAIAQIPKLPPPTLTKPNDWSPEFNRFLARCLNKDYKLRPSAIELLGDPWISKAIRTDTEAIKKASPDSKAPFSALSGVPGANSVLMPFVSDVLKRRTVRRASGETGTVDGTFNLNSNATKVGTEMDDGDDEGTMVFRGGTNVTSGTRASGNSSVATTLPWNAAGTVANGVSTIVGDNAGSMVVSDAAPKGPVKPHALAGVKLMDVTARNNDGSLSSPKRASPTSSTGSDGIGAGGAYGKLGRRVGVTMVDVGTQTEFSRRQRVKYWGTVLALSLAIGLVWNGLLWAIQTMTADDELLPIAVSS